MKNDIHDTYEPYHHGVKGQKWGVRRYQNRDGSYTPEGRKRYSTGSIVEIRPMSRDKLQGLRCKIATVDEWLSGDVREDVIGALEQGASKLDD